MKTKCDEKTPLTVKNFDKNFTDIYRESEPLVALHNCLIGKLSGWNELANITDETIEVLVKVFKEDKPCKAIYRRAIGYTAKGLTSQDIMLSYRSRKRLNVKEGEKVIVKRTCWFMYLWNHAQSRVRYPFQIAFCFGVISIILAVASLAIGIYQICCCC